MRTGGAKLLVTLSVVILVLAITGESGEASSSGGVRSSGAERDGTCGACHAGIEEMHPEADLSCVDCHGGDPGAEDKERAHVSPPRATRSGGENERVWPLEKSLEWRRFLNPMDLRVAGETCGECHADDVHGLRVSLHGTTAGHLSDGYFEVGLSSERVSGFAVFETRDPPREGGGVEALRQVPAFRMRSSENGLAAHFPDLARKECMQCHLWSQGVAVRGRVGFDGDYRGEGCAACHVEYSVDGISESGDRRRKSGEPGHPLRHRLMRSAPTSTCTTCHNGDASIGLSFQGLSQLPPDAPGGPDIPGTTDRQLHREFFLNDPEICPPDIHYERGMDCVDCHGKAGVMGDGRLNGHMEQAVKISCEACHGSPQRTTNLRTEDGRPLEHLRWEADRVIMTGRVSGREFVVPQAAHVVDPDRPEYNPRAARAMVESHSSLECYACHAAWNPNFIGFHFSRNESLSQLDLISGKRTPGRVTTQEKVFATWKSLYLGRNASGRVAPYMTGFSTMGSVWDDTGELIIDQAMPETAEGLSGMTMVHHQVHTTRDTARSCVECHRISSTWGMGSGNFKLGRQLGFVADRRGIEFIALDHSELGKSLPLFKFPLPDVLDLAVQSDPVQGHARMLFAAEGKRGIHTLDVSNPLRPKRVNFFATIEPRAIELVGTHLFIADGAGGLRILDVSEPADVREVGHVTTFDAHDVDVRWPFAYVADGAGGLTILDVRVPSAARIITVVDLFPESALPNQAIAVETLFQYSRPVVEDGEIQDRRSQARNLCAVLDRERGLVVVDVTEPSRSELLFPTAPMRSASRVTRNRTFRGLALRSQVDPAEAQGGNKTKERDYVYLLAERGSGGFRRSVVLVFDITNPLGVRFLRIPRADAAAGYSTEQLIAADFYNPPFRKRILFSSGERGVYLEDVSLSKKPRQVGALGGIRNAYAVAVEEFPLDRMIDELGVRQKDVSHRHSRWLHRSEIDRIFSVDDEALGTNKTYENPAGFFGEEVLSRFNALDRDDSGFLESSEFVPSPDAGADLNQDGRIQLLELKAFRGGVRAGIRYGETESTQEARVFEDGDLARLLDGVDPFAFDRNGNRSLDRREMDKAFFAALDLDGNGGLSMDELSRYPGDTRSLRYKDPTAAELFHSFQETKDAEVTPREFRVADPEWSALDSDGDGGVLLLEGVYGFERDRGWVRDGSEWPTRRRKMVPLSPLVRADELLAEFDANEDGKLARREMKSRPELFVILDRNRDGYTRNEEIEAVVNRIARAGSDACPDDFEGRWDLNGNGSVDEKELSRIAFLRLSPYL